MKTLLFLLSLSFVAPVLADEPTPEVKTLLVSGIQLYIDTKYDKAIEIFEQVRKIDPTNELAEQYIQSSRQRLSEIELSPELALPNKALDK